MISELLPLDSLLTAVEKITAVGATSKPEDARTWLQESSAGADLYVHSSTTQRAAEDDACFREPCIVFYGLGRSIYGLAG